MSEIQTVTVYCSSSKAVAPVYFDAAERLGQGIARRGWKLVYGGNNVGVMGRLADAVRAAGGRVVGITPKLLVDKGIADGKCDELVVTDSMRERKRMLEERADAFVTLPGGVGTFEEIFEILVGRSLASHDKPIVLLNVNGYYDPLLAMMSHAVRERFVREGVDELWFVTDDVEAGLRHIQESRAPRPPAPGAGEAMPSAIE
jgi:hypothetical protein